MAHFCADLRLLGVGYVPLDNPGRVPRRGAGGVIRLGVWEHPGSSTPAGTGGPAELELDPFWSLLAETARPPCCTPGLPWGSAPGRRPTTAAAGAWIRTVAGENLLSALTRWRCRISAEMFLAALVYDGLFDLPRRRCAAGDRIRPLLGARVPASDGYTSAQIEGTDSPVRGGVAVVAKPSETSANIGRSSRRFRARTLATGPGIRPGDRQTLQRLPAPEGTNDLIGRFEPHLHRADRGRSDALLFKHLRDDDGRTGAGAASNLRGDALHAKTGE